MEATEKDKGVLVLENELLRAEVCAGYRGYVSDLRLKSSGKNVLEKFDAETDSAWYFQVRTGIESLSTGRCGQAVRIVEAEQPLRCTTEYSLDSKQALMRMEMTILNTGAAECNALWGNHLIVDPNFTGKDFRIETPATSYFDMRDDPILRQRWPMSVEGEDLRTMDWQSRRYVLTDFNEGICRLTGLASGMTFEYRWDAAKFPYCMMRRSMGMLMNASTGLPTALEEGHGLVTIAPGGSETAWVEIRLVAE